MNQQEQEFLREKQKILKLMPDSVAFSREEAKLLETMTEELLEYKRICSLPELKMLCEDAERYAALDNALFLYSEERSEKNCLNQEILNTLTNIAKRYKNKNKESEVDMSGLKIIGNKMKKDIPTQEKDTSFCTTKESNFKFQLKQRIFYVYKGWEGGYFYCPAFILSRKDEIEHAYKDERHWRLDIDNTLSKTKWYNSYEIFAMYDTKSDKVKVSEEELCATEKEAIARVTELNKENQKYLELD